MGIAGVSRRLPQGGELFLLSPRTLPSRSGFGGLGLGV